MDNQHQDNNVDNNLQNLHNEVGIHGDNTFHINMDQHGNQPDVMGGNPDLQACHSNVSYTEGGHGGNNL